MERVVWRPKQTGRSRPFLQPILEIFQVSAWDGSRGSHAYLQQRFLRSGDPANGPSADSQLPHFYGGKGRIEPAVYPRKSALLHRFAKDHGAFTVLGSWWQGRGSTRGQLRQVGAALRVGQERNRFLEIRRQHHLVPESRDI